jgi:hypothetical protein
LRFAVLTIGGLCFAACSAGAPTSVLKGKLDLPIAEGHAYLAACPSEDLGGPSDTVECVLGPVEDAFAPYEASLTEKGWKKEGNGWSSADGATCLAISLFDNEGGPPGTVAEFHWLDPKKDKEAICPV